MDGVKNVYLRSLALLLVRDRIYVGFLMGHATTYVETNAIHSTREQ